jgi:hypothetical protein
MVTVSTSYFCMLSSNVSTNVNSSFDSKGKSTNASLSSFYEESVFGLRVLKSDWGESVIKSRDLRGFCTSVVTVIYTFPMNPEELVLLQTSINI